MNVLYQHTFSPNIVIFEFIFLHFYLPPSNNYQSKRFLKPQLSFTKVFKFHWVIHFFIFSTQNLRLGIFINIILWTKCCGIHITCNTHAPVTTAYGKVAHRVNLPIFNCICKQLECVTTWWHKWFEIIKYLRRHHHNTGSMIRSVLICFFESGIPIQWQFSETSL